MATTNIGSGEYQKFMELRESLKTGMADAESEFMFQTYKKLIAVMNNRQEAANKLNITMENEEIRKLQDEKRKKFDADKAKDA